MLYPKVCYNELLAYLGLWNSKMLYFSEFIEVITVPLDEMLKKLNGMYNSSRKSNFLTKNIDIFSDFSTKKKKKKTEAKKKTKNKKKKTKKNNVCCEYPHSQHMILLKNRKLS